MPNVVERVIAKVTKSGQSSTSEPDAITSGQTNIAVGATIATLGAAITTLFTDSLITAVLGPNPPASTRAVLAVGFLSAAAVIVAADLLARAYASKAAAARDVPLSKSSTKSTDQPGVAGTVNPLVTIYTDGRPSPGWTLLGVSGEEAVVLKPGESLRRVSIGDVGGQ